MMLDNTINLVSTYTDLIIFCAYLFVGTALLYTVFVKLKLETTFFAISFCGFIYVCALNHLAFFLNNFDDFKLFISLTKALKATTAILTSVAVWPFLRDALHFRSLSDNEKQRKDLKTYKEAYQDAVIGMALLDKEGKLIRANNELAKLFEYDQDSLLKVNLYQFIEQSDIDKNKRLFKKIYKSTDEVFDFNLKFIKKTGQNFIGKVQLKVRRKDCGSIDFISVQIADITRELEIENELQRERLNAENDRKVEYLKTMASSIAHEINNPLTIISGAAQITAISLKKEEVKKELIQKEMADINESVLRISNIIKSLKMLTTDTKEEQGQYPVSSILDNVISLVQPQFSSNDVDFNVDQDDAIFLKEILCNQVHMSQVFINLLNNSFEAVKKSDEKWIKIQSYQDGEFIVFDIIDSGEGISKEHEDKIYLPFFSSKAQTESTGLGLSYAKSVIESYQGTLKLIKGDNTTFRITLPLERQLKIG